MKLQHLIGIGMIAMFGITVMAQDSACEHADEEVVAVEIIAENGDTAPAPEAVPESVEAVPESVEADPESVEADPESEEAALEE